MSGLVPRMLLAKFAFSNGSAVVVLAKPPPPPILGGSGVHFKALDERLLLLKAPRIGGLGARTRHRFELTYSEPLLKYCIAHYFANSIRTSTPTYSGIFVLGNRLKNQLP